MEWTIILKDTFAYKVVDGLLLVTTNIAWDGKTGKAFVMANDEDEMDVVKLKVDANGKITSQVDWLDLRQFNVCHNILTLIEGIQIALKNSFGIAPHKTSIEETLKQPAIFKVSNVTGNLAPYDLTATLTIGTDSYLLQKQFIKYTFIDGGIEDRTWSIPELFNFAVHLQAFLYREETVRVKPGNRPNYTDVNKEVEELLK